MSAFGILMAGYCVAAVMLILWFLAIEAHEAVRKRRMTPTERRLREYADEVDRRDRETEAARRADEATRQRTRERWGL